MNDEILKEIQELKGNLRSLTEALYGRNPNDSEGGDIGIIKIALRDANNIKARLIRLEAIVFVIASGGVTGITKGMGWW